MSDLKPTSRDHTDRIRKLRAQRKREQDIETYGAPATKAFEAVPREDRVTDAQTRRAERSGS